LDSDKQTKWPLVRVIFFSSFFFFLLLLLPLPLLLLLLLLFSHAQYFHQRTVYDDEKTSELESVERYFGGGDEHPVLAETAMGFLYVRAARKKFTAIMNRHADIAPASGFYFNNVDHFLV